MADCPRVPRNADLHAGFLIAFPYERRGRSQQEPRLPPLPKDRLKTLPSQTILPPASTTHTLAYSNDTSIPE
jgi:hypothetical protein